VSARRAVEGVQLAQRDTVRVLALSTYEGSGEAVHPDYVAPPAPWPVARKYLVVTPFAGGRRTNENPSLFVGVNGIRWWPDRRTPHPLVTPGFGYLSDPDIVYDPQTVELILYYRHVTSDNIIYQIRSSDGQNWSEPVEVLREYGSRIVSPAVVRRSATEWLMWSVDASAGGCEATWATVELRRSTDGVSWSEPQRLELGKDGLTSPWHLDVQWIPSRQEYWALYNPKSPGSCGTRSAMLATSRDGVEWTSFPSPVLSARAIPEFNDIVYRSTFSYDPRRDIVTFWFSGARVTRTGVVVWSTATQKRNRALLFTDLSLEPPPELRALPSSRLSMIMQPPSP
jgi:hypothetical protein